MPRSFDARYGAGLDHGLCLGGGGLFFVAWQVAYLHTLSTYGIRFDSADRIVGTSAGSMVACTLAGGKLGRLHGEVKLLARAPKVVAALAPASELRPSQQRALDLFLLATDADVNTIRSIGHAALAASTTTEAAMRRNTGLVLGWGPLIPDTLWISCVDAFTGERCVLTGDGSVTLARAVAASSAVPGLFPPQLIGDRRCMDGGVSGTGLHLDLLAGTRRVLALSLTDGTTRDEGMMTTQPGDIGGEVDQLNQAGSDVILRTPTEVDLAELMSPAAVPRALAMGRRQASDDVGLLARFWS
jgi:NTE family protein